MTVIKKYMTVIKLYTVPVMLINNKIVKCQWAIYIIHYIGLMFALQQLWCVHD